MSFIVVRLGKDSVDDIRSIDAIDNTGFTPFEIEFKCKQVEATISADSFTFIYLGSDNNKGIATDWKQGLRAFGRLTSLKMGPNFNSESVLKIRVISVFTESYNRTDFLDHQPALYSHFSEYPVIGVSSFRNNAVQKVNEGPRANSPALLTALYSLFPGLHDNLAAHAPELLPSLAFSSTAAIGSGSPSTVDSAAMKGSNVIFYGAPGTGKSYTIDRSVLPAFSFKTVFHAETMNADFLGSIKPTMVEDQSGNQLLTYSYIPGPFLNALTKAIENQEHHYWLIVEEINRAPAAAVFGEIFQLLDRRSDGRSTYEIDFPDSLCKKYVNSQLTTPIERLYIPSNLSLYASMNSSDQGVLPLDTAFKRRWIFDYIALDFEQGCTEGNLDLVLENDMIRSISWRDLAISINRLLSDIDIPEDRHLGPYFISNDDLEDSSRLLTGKLFMYLWDDVLRHGLRHTVFHSDIKTYGHLVSQWDKKRQIFSDSLIELIGHSIITPESTSQDSAQSGDDANTASPA